jgi:hypothetical protein
MPSLLLSGIVREDAASLLQMSGFGMQEPAWKLLDPCKEWIQIGSSPLAPALEVMLLSVVAHPLWLRILKLVWEHSPFHQAIILANPTPIWSHSSVTWQLHDLLGACMTRLTRTL